MSVPCVHYIYYIIQKKVGYLRESGKANKEMTSLRFVYFFYIWPSYINTFTQKESSKQFLSLQKVTNGDKMHSFLSIFQYCKKEIFWIFNPEKGD